MDLFVSSLSLSASYRDYISVVPVVPEILVAKVLDIFHQSSGHFGISTMLHKTKSTVLFPKLYLGHISFL